MMYAVIESGGKQYRVAVGDRVKVETLKAEPGAEVQLDRVLMVADGDQIEVGAPYTKVAVGAKVVAHGRGEKIRILKFRRRKNSRTHAGHRQNYTELEITSIGGKTAAPKKAAAKKTKKKVSAKADDQAAKKTKKAGAAEAPAKKKKATKKAAPVKKAEKTDDKATGSGGDLTQLTGVGPVLAKKLEKAGVTSLAQVAGWTEEDIARIDEELNFKGRIQRDDWVGQAKKLIK